MAYVLKKQKNKNTKGLQKAKQQNKNTKGLQKAGVGKLQNENTKGLQKAGVGQKVYISISLILATLLLVFIVLIQLFPIFPTMKYSPIFKWVGDGEWFDWRKEFTTFGIVMISSISVIGSLLISSFIVLLLMKSFKLGSNKSNNNKLGSNKSNDNKRK